MEARYALHENTPHFQHHQFSSFRCTCFDKESRPWRKLPDYFILHEERAEQHRTTPPPPPPVCSDVWSDGSNLRSVRAFSNSEISSYPEPCHNPYHNPHQSPFRLPPPKHSFHNSAITEEAASNEQNSDHSGRGYTNEELHLNFDGRGRGACVPFMTDETAAACVSTHLAGFPRRPSSSRHAAALFALVHDSSRGGASTDGQALEIIFEASNDIVFHGCLTGRVKWGWSDASSNPQYDDKVLGHTSLRQARDGGIETFILLSTPILKNPQYSQRLLISAFLHELIHCYLFVCCGWQAREAGGHTHGFVSIAGMVDHWIGRNVLHLRHMEADLERFRLARHVFHAKQYHDYHAQRPAEDRPSLQSSLHNIPFCSSPPSTHWGRYVDGRVP